MRILVLDDNRSLMESVAAMLGAQNHQVETTDDAHKAVGMVSETEYDFVLVDYKMPVNDGIWFMKNAHIPPKTKVLLMTAYVDRAVISEMFRLGAVGYIIKPFDCEDLMRHMEFHSAKR